MYDLIIVGEIGENEVTRRMLLAIESAGTTVSRQLGKTNMINAINELNLPDPIEMYEYTPANKPWYRQKMKY